MEEVEKKIGRPNLNMKSYHAKIEGDLAVVLEQQPNKNRYINESLRMRMEKEKLINLVARAKIDNEIRNIFFVFNNNDISKFRFDGVLGDSEMNININIEYDTRTGKAYIYNGKNRADISYNMNRFEL